MAVSVAWQGFYAAMETLFSHELHFSVELLVTGIKDPAMEAHTVH